MRVISGAARGTVLFSPQGDKTRPTSDFVKENLFNIIRADIIGARFLDLFAGTGAIGIEALSRGAAFAVFVEVSPKCFSVIRRNLEKTRFVSHASIVKSDVVTAVKKLNGQHFDLIFLDPPYLRDFTDKALREIVEQDILSKDGYIILEMSKMDKPPQVTGLTIFREKEYSGTRLVFYEIHTEVNDEVII